MPARPLYLHEELMLLALRDREGTVPAGASWLGHGLAGGLLSELLLRGRLRLVRERKRDLVEPVRDEPVGEPLLDEALDRVAGAKRRAALGTWLARLAVTKELRHRVARGLCRLGVLRADEAQVLLFFSRRVYPELDPEPERELLARLRSAISGEEGEPSERTVALLSIAHATGLLHLAIDKRELKRSADRIDVLVESERVGRAAKQTIQSIQAAVIAATVASTAAATS